MDPRLRGDDSGLCLPTRALHGSIPSGRQPQVRFEFNSGTARHYGAQTPHLRTEASTGKCNVLLRFSQRERRGIPLSVRVSNLLTLPLRNAQGRSVFSLRVFNLDEGFQTP
jgi:hypothetical protein